MRSGINHMLKNEDGAALVEFAILLPSLLLFLAVSIEGGRTFWAYQSTISGVRDAARYLSRVVPSDICATNSSVSQWDEKLTDIVRNSQTGSSLFPAGIAVSSVTSTLACIGGNYRGTTAPIATVTAHLEIDYLFSGVFSFIGVPLERVRTTVSDQSRVLGV